MSFPAGPACLCKHRVDMFHSCSLSFGRKTGSQESFIASGHTDNFENHRIPSDVALYVMQHLYCALSVILLIILLTVMEACRLDLFP